MAAPSVLRRRRADALDRANVAANELGKVYPQVADEAEKIGRVRDRDQVHTEVARMEALADLLEAVAVATGVMEPEDVGTNLESQDELAQTPEEDSSRDFRELEDIDGIGPDLAEKLEEAGYETPEDLGDASDEELLKVDGVGPSTLKKIREDL